MSPAVWTKRPSYSSRGADWTIQYARNPSPVNLSNQPPERRMPWRTELTNLSMTKANRSNFTDSFINVVDSRMSAAITNIWIGSPSITESKRSLRRKRFSQSGGAWGFNSRATRARSLSRRPDAGRRLDATTPPPAACVKTANARDYAPWQPTLPAIVALKRNAPYPFAHLATEPSEDYEVLLISRTWRPHRQVVSRA